MTRSRTADGQPPTGSARACTALTAILLLSVTPACSSDGGGPRAASAPSTASVAARPTAAATPMSRGSASALEGVHAPPAARLDRTDEFGNIVQVVTGPTGSVLIVDRVDMLVGAEAEKAARARGADFSNDYFLVNDNPTLRRYRLSASPHVWGSLLLAKTVDVQAVPLATLLSALKGHDAQRQATLFHLQVDDGAISGVEEQYRP